MVIIALIALLCAPLMCAEVTAEPAWVEKPIIVIIPSYNNIRWYKRNINALMSQDVYYTNWHAFYIDDCSDDGTGDAVKQFIEEKGYDRKITLIKNSTRRGALANIYSVVHRCKDNKIIVVYDGDDFFVHETVLYRINKVYQNPNVWLTYGQFIEFPTGRLGFCEPFPDDVIGNNAYRDYRWITSHVRTFYAGLFKKIRREDLLYEGSFFPMATDVAVMMPMLEMAAGRMAFVPEILLLYNTTNPLNLFRTSARSQKFYADYIRAQPRYQKIEQWRS